MSKIIVSSEHINVMSRSNIMPFLLPLLDHQVHLTVVVCCVAWLGHATRLQFCTCLPDLLPRLISTLSIASFAWIKELLSRPTQNGRTILKLQMLKEIFNCISIKLKFVTAFFTPFGHESYLAFVYVCIFLQNTSIRYFLEGTTILVGMTLSTRKYQTFSLS